MAGVRALAILHLDDGRTPACVAEALYVTENAVRKWRQAYRERGSDLIAMAGYSQREGLLSKEQEQRLKAIFAERPPRDTIAVRACVMKEFSVACSRQGPCKPLHRLGFVFVKPQPIPKAADEQSQLDFIKLYEGGTNGLRPSESVVFADAVHPAYLGVSHSDFALSVATALQRVSLSNGAVKVQLR